jgi:hypothetical protein
MTKIIERLAVCVIAIALFFAPAKAENPLNKFTVSGYIKDSESGEALIGAGLYVRELKTGTATNSYGFYSISLEPGKYLFTYTFIGFGAIQKEVELKSSLTMNIDMVPDQKTLNDVVVTAERPDANVKQAEMSVVRLDMKTVEKIPALMGEVDVLKAIQMLPGVQSTSEGTSGFSVRGGGIDQNLILLDEATVYNASHLMGFFSVFNNDAVRDMKLYKGDMPAAYGGRLSSVLDVRMKDGNNKKFHATGGIGLISSRLTLEGPIVNERTSFLISGRRTYVDVFFPLFPDSGLKKAKMYFYDFNLKLNHQINQNNRIFLSGYAGRDNFGQKGSSDAAYGNQTATLRWNHLFTEKLFANVTAVYAKYNYSLQMDMGGSKYFWNSQMLDNTLKVDFNWFLNPQNEVKFGASSTYHDFNPCDAWIEGGKDTLTVPYPKSYALEHGFYLSNQQKIGDKLTLKYGLRYTIFQNLGKTSMYTYDDSYNVADTLYYSKNQIYHTYMALEPRIGLNYLVDDKSSVKASYSRTVQYVQLASNSNGGMPLDVWFPSSPNVQPQKADQFAAGYFRNFLNNMVETSVEAYYKNLYHVVDFKDHPELLMNPRMEGEIRTGKGRAYGLEFLVRKNEGALTGWVSYTLSKVERKVPEINGGNYYPAPYDKPHNINVIVSYELSPRVELASNWIYATGAPYTAPVGTFTMMDGTVNKIYSSRNGYRMRDYHRLDLSVTLKNKEVPGRRWHGEWVFSVYNAYGRHNDWVINFTQDSKNPKVMKAERWYLPFEFFPGITYNFHF